MEKKSVTQQTQTVSGVKYCKLRPSFDIHDVTDNLITCLSTIDAKQ